jgi:hypothetical protein
LTPARLLAHPWLVIVVQLGNTCNIPYNTCINCS